MRTSKAKGLIDGGYMSTSNDKYNKLKTAFGRAVSKRFGKNLMGSYLYTDTVSKYENETECLAQLQKDIEGSVDYVQAYARRQSNAQYKKRSQLEQAVVDAHGPMLKAVQEKYPRYRLGEVLLCRGFGYLLVEDRRYPCYIYALYSRYSEAKE